MTTTQDTLDLHNSPDALVEYQGKSGLRADEESFIAEFFPAPPASVLDLGSGMVGLTAPLHGRGYQVVGIEYCSQLVEIANRLHPEVKIEQGDARKLRLPMRRLMRLYFHGTVLTICTPSANGGKCLKKHSGSLTRRQFLGIQP